MFKKLLFLSLFSLLFFGSMGESSPDGLAQLEQAKNYKEKGEYAKAEEIYQNIIDYALKAQKGLVTLYIDSGDDSAAEAAFDKLIANFSGHPDLPRALHSIGEEYYKKGRYQKAMKIWKVIIQLGDKEKIDKGLSAWVQYDIARCYIAEKNFSSAKAELDKLERDYPEDKLAVCWAEYCLALMEYTKGEIFSALPRCQRIMSEKIGERKLYAYTLWLMGKIYIWLGEDAEAEEMFEKVIAEYSDYAEPLYWSKMGLMLLRGHQ